MYFCVCKGWPADVFAWPGVSARLVWPPDVLVDDTTVEAATTSQAVTPLADSISDIGVFICL